jgi:hypothetical protein
MEFGNHSEFLNIMSRSEMLSYFFVHDMDDTKSWRLKGHAVDLFYQWMSSWAVFLSKPSDIGFTDDGFILPPLNIIEKKVITAKVDNGRLFNDISVDATQHNSELRRTKSERMNLAAQIANSTDDTFIVWIKHGHAMPVARDWDFRSSSIWLKRMAERSLSRVASLGDPHSTLRY